jgi:hypothetical protein
MVKLFSICDSRFAHELGYTHEFVARGSSDLDGALIDVDHSPKHLRRISLSSPEF